MSNFTTENNLTIKSYNGLREQLKPSWRGILKPENKLIPLTVEKTNKLKNDIYQAESFLNNYGYTIHGSNIMDVGCYAGIQCYAAIELGAKSSKGIDIPEYFTLQTTGKNINNNNDVEEHSNLYTQKRKEASAAFSPETLSKVSFEDLSIHDLKEKEKYDIIFSWETLEHVIDNNKGFANIYNALVPGGVSLHTYNPFFSITGGHSLCTTNAPWGHARMTVNDFKKYTEENLPNDVPDDFIDISLNFFTQNLNRMTQRDLKQILVDNGFEILEFIPHVKYNMMQNIDNEIFYQIKQLYPTVTITDLISDYVTVLIKKPE